MSQIEYTTESIWYWLIPSFGVKKTSKLRRFVTRENIWEIIFCAVFSLFAPETPSLLDSSSIFLAFQVMSKVSTHFWGYVNNFDSFLRLCQQFWLIFEVMTVWLICEVMSTILTRFEVMTLCDFEVWIEILRFELKFWCLNWKIT